MTKIIKILEELYYHETSKEAIERDWLILFGMAVGIFLMNREYHIPLDYDISIPMFIVLGLMGIISIGLGIMNPSNQLKPTKSRFHN